MRSRPYLVAALYRAVREYHRRSRCHRIIRRSRLSFWPTDPLLGEVRARDLLARAEAACVWVPRPLYPAGGAAGPLLLYLLIRALGELPISRVLDIGAGLTTRVLRASGKEFLTLEHDSAWAAAMGVVPTPLTAIPGPDGGLAWYDIAPPRRFDLVIVDGPPGTRRWSRYGIVHHVPEWCLEQWAVLWDDLDRPGDLESFAALIERLRSQNVAHDHVLIDGDRAVGIIHTPQFSGLRQMW